MAKPFIKWAGGKTSLLPELLKRIPKDFNCYYEPFLGGGALFYQLAERDLIKQGSVISDINWELINSFNVVKDNLDQLIKLLETKPNEKNYFYFMREQDRMKDINLWDKENRAARFIYLIKTGYNGLYRVNLRGELNTPFGDYKNPNICDVKTLKECSNLLQKVVIGWQEFRVVEFTASENDFIYFDPPYYPVKEGSFTSYQEKKFGEESHIDLFLLFSRLSKKGVNCMLSNSDTPFTRDLYRDFNIETVTARRNINSKGDQRGPVNEIIVRNYE